MVGGTAEEFWTQDEYGQTDLDLCSAIGPAERAILADLGFRKSGRHWVNPDIHVAVEFPDSEIDGDYQRTAVIEVGTGAARLISREDLYVDRVLQATADSSETGRFMSALAIAVSGYETMDWPYIAARLRKTIQANPLAGSIAKGIDSRIRRRARRQLSS